MMRSHRFFIGVWLCAGLLTACDRDSSPPPVTFAPSGEGYATKMDFARLEHEFPLTADDLLKITPENLEGATQEEVDQIYARLTAGPIPDGAFQGRMFFPKGSTGQARVAEIVGGGFKGRIVDFKSAKLEHLGEIVWKGKVFDRSHRILRNRINDLAVLKPVLGDNVGSIQKLEVDGKDTWLLFPAKLYCGQSLLDGRRESIIIDYAFTDDIEGYREMPDALAGREGLQIRDEIRMVRPGFYLGRAYMKRAFVLNFTLYNTDLADKDTAAFKASGKVNEDCWVGPQRVAAMAK
ncbi:MAG: hypothetical protein ACREJU_04215 [Nitrospiraceae bacterium]